MTSKPSNTIPPSLRSFSVSLFVFHLLPKSVTQECVLQSKALINSELNNYKGVIAKVSGQCYELQLLIKRLFAGQGAAQPAATWYPPEAEGQQEG